MHGRFPGHVADREHAAVRETDDLEESREVPDLPHQSPGADFLFHVRSDVGGQGVSRVSGGDNQRNQSGAQPLVQVERRQLRRHERMHGAHGGASRQQIHAAAAKFAGAGAGEDEAGRVRLFEQVVHGVKQFGRPLDLIDDDVALVAIAEYQLAQAFGAGSQLAKGLGLQQVDGQRIGKLLPRPGRLAGASGPEQKEATGSWLEESP